MRLYSLNVNETSLVEVEMVGYDWLPIRPRLNSGWLRSIVGCALRTYLRKVSLQPRS
jgi:hypothetical protein